MRFVQANDKQQSHDQESHDMREMLEVEQEWIEER